MCNLYNVTTNQEALRALTKAFDRLGNLQPSLDVYPDRPAPVVRNTTDGREMAMLTWGMPTPQTILQGRPLCWQEVTADLSRIKAIRM